MTAKSKLTGKEFEPWEVLIDGIIGSVIGAGWLARRARMGVQEVAKELLEETIKKSSKEGTEKVTKEGTKGAT